MVKDHLVLSELGIIYQKFGIQPTAEPLVKLRHFSRHGGLTKLWSELGYRIGAEIGTEQGKFAEEICRDNPGVRLYSVDPYLAYDRYADHVDQEKLEVFRMEALARLRPYYITYIRAQSLEAVSHIIDGALDFVFLDGNHDFDFIVRDIIAWAPKVRRGGCVAGHDYKPEGAEKTPIPFGVIEAVDGYTHAHKIRPVFLTGSDKCPSWFWIKT
jgi:hypothetical protein